MGCLELIQPSMIQSPQLRRALITVLLAFAIANAFLLWNARDMIRQGYGGFSAFYTAGKMLVSGHGRSLYNLHAQWELQRQFAPQVKIRSGPLPYVRPPFEAMLFAPFTLFSYSNAILLWTMLKLAILAAIPWMVSRAASSSREFSPWLLAVLSFGTYPVFVDFEQGHDSVLLAFLFAVAFVSLAKGREHTAGFVLGLALFKLHFVIPFVAILWIAGKRRLVASFATAALALFAASLAIVGWNGLMGYPHYVLALNRSLGAGMVTPEYQINLRGLFTLFIGRSAQLGAWQWLLLLVALAGILWGGYLWKKSGDRNLPEAFGFALIVSILTSLYAYSYDLTLLLVPLFSALTGGLRPESFSIPARLGPYPPETPPRVPDRFTRACTIVGILLLLCTPLYWLLKLRWQAEYLVTLPLALLAFGLSRRLKNLATHA